MKDLDLIKTEVHDAIREFLKEYDNLTVWSKLEDNKDGTFAIVVGYGSGFDEKEKDTYADGDGYRICMKVAFHSKKNIMHSYDTDWVLPADHEGECVDLEIPIYEDTNIDETVEYLVNEYQKYKKDLQEQIVHLEHIQWDIDTLGVEDPGQAHLPSEIFISGVECRDEFGTIDEDKIYGYLERAYNCYADHFDVCKEEDEIDLER